MNPLTLKARYRNARLTRTPFHRMEPALQCMALIREYRDLTEAMHDGNEFAESSLAYVELEFASAREEMRRGFRATASIALLERLADNPIAEVA